MSISINSGFVNNNGINKTSAQYKAVVRDSMASILQSEAMMSDEERLIYETFGAVTALSRIK